MRHPLDLTAGSGDAGPGPTRAPTDGRSSARATRPPGTVYLVGAGPGDPGLLTVRAADLLRRADVVVYDALANDRLLSLAPVGAELVYAGKRHGGRHLDQREIERLLIRAAERVDVVVRLKGGDPFVFGRGGEEALALRTAGVPFEVVPGITSATGVAAYAGIPITHRGRASTVTLVTGHAEPGGPNAVAWDRIARLGGTLVVYMGLRQLPAIADRLLRNGCAPGTPTAVVEWGTYGRQRTVTAPLAEIARRTAAARIEAPALVVVGDVVGLRAELEWFERRPLTGRRVLVARARALPSRLIGPLEALGAEVLQGPELHVREPVDPTALRDAVERLPVYEWLLFTSGTSVDVFLRALVSAGTDIRALHGLRCVCVGPRTARALLRWGIRADIECPSYVPGRVVAALGGPDTLGSSRALMPRAEGAYSEIARTLDTSGVSVDEVVAYRLVADPATARNLRRRLAASELDAIAFASSSTVERFAGAIGTDTGDASVAVIGPRTAAAARRHGFRVDVVAAEGNFPGLVEALADHLARAS